MSQNAQVFGTNKVVLDELPVDGVLQVSVKDEAEPRLRLYADGTIKTGNGTAAPATTSLSIAAGDVRYISTPTAWVAPTLINSWTNLGAGYQTTRYRKKGTDVELEGVIHGGVTDTNCFILPVGFRPAMIQRFMLDASGGPAIVLITSDGQVHINNGTASDVNAFVSLTGIRFSTL